MLSQKRYEAVYFSKCPCDDKSIRVRFESHIHVLFARTCAVCFVEVNTGSTLPITTSDYNSITKNKHEFIAYLVHFIPHLNQKVERKGKYTCINQFGE